MSPSSQFLLWMVVALNLVALGLTVKLPGLRIVFRVPAVWNRIPRRVDRHTGILDELFHPQHTSRPVPDLPPPTEACADARAVEPVRPAARPVAIAAPAAAPDDCAEGRLQRDLARFRDRYHPSTLEPTFSSAASNQSRRARA